MKRNARRVLAVTLSLAMTVICLLPHIASLPGVADDTNTVSLDLFKAGGAYVDLGGMAHAIENTVVDQNLSSGQTTSIDVEALMGDNPWRAEYLDYSDAENQVFKDMTVLSATIASDKNAASATYGQQAITNRKLGNTVTAQLVSIQGGTYATDPDAMGGMGLSTGVYDCYLTTNSAHRVLCYTYVAPVSGTYTIGQVESVRSPKSTAQMSTYETSNGKTVKLGFAIHKTAAGVDSYAVGGATKIWPQQANYTYLDVNCRAFDFPTIEGVHLNKGDTLRFVMDTREATATDYGFLQARMSPTVALVETDAELYTTGSLSNLSGMAWEMEDFFLGLNGTSGTTYEMSQDSLLEGNPWRAEYLTAEQVFAQTDRATFSQGTAITNRKFGMVNRAQLLTIQGSTADKAGVHEAANTYTAYFHPYQNDTMDYRVLAYSYTAPYAGTYSISQLRSAYAVKTPQQMAEAEAATDGQKIKLGFAIVKMSGDDYADETVTRLYPTDGSDYAYITSESDSRNLSVPTINEVYLKQGETIRFIVDVTENTYTGSWGYLEFGFRPQVSLIATEAENYDIYSAGYRTDLSGLAWAMENHVVENGLKSQQVSKIAVGELVDADYPWRSEYLRYTSSGVVGFQPMTRLSATIATDGNEASATYGNKAITNRKYGYEAQTQLVSIQGGSYSATDLWGGLQMSAAIYEPYLCTQNGHRVLAYSYVVPVSGHYTLSQIESVRSPKSTAQMAAAEAEHNGVIKIGVAIHKMSADDNGFEPSASTKLWPVDANYAYIDNTARELNLPTLENVYLEKGEVLRFVIDARESTVTAGDFLQLRVSPQVKLTAVDQTKLEQPGATPPAIEDQKPDLTGKTQWDSIQSLMEAARVSTNNEAGVWKPFTAADTTPWQVQYQILGTTMYGDKPMYWSVENCYLGTKVGASFRDASNYPANAIQQADYRINVDQPIVNCLNTSGIADDLKPVAALSFLAPEDGTYWFAANESVTDLFGIWPGQAKENVIKFWIEKDGVQIWPENGQPIELHNAVSCMELPALTVAMEQGDAVRYCVQGTRLNGDHNNVFLAPMAAKLGDYDAKNDPVPESDDPKEKEPDPNATPDLTDKLYWDSIETLMESARESTNETPGVWKPLTAVSPWQVQYQILGTTMYYDVPMYWSVENCYLGEKAGASFRDTSGYPQNAIQMADRRINAAQPIINCLNTAGVADDLKPVAAISFIAPSDGTYWLGSNKDISEMFGIWPGQAKENAIKFWIEKDGVQIWPEDGQPLELKSGADTAILPGLTVAMEQGDAVRYCVQGTRLNGDHNNVYLAPMAVKMGDYDLEQDPVPESDDPKEKAPDPNATPDLTGKEVWDSLESLISAVKDSVKEPGTWDTFTAVDSTPWRVQYRILETTMYYDRPMFWTIESCYLGKAGNVTLRDASGYPQNAVQQADHRINPSQPLIHCLNTASTADKLAPVVALSFIAPSDGTYWLGSNKDISEMFGIWPGQAKENPIKIWIEKDGKQIWPEGDKPLELSNQLSATVLPGLTVAMEKGDAVRFCVQGTRANGDHNNVYLAPMAVKMGDYDLAQDPVPESDDPKEKAPDPNAAPDLSGKPVWDARDSLLAAAKDSVSEVGVWEKFTAADTTPWQVQYQIIGVTTYYGEQMYWSTENVYVGAGGNATFRDSGGYPTNAIQQADHRINPKQPLVNCLNSGSSKDKLNPIAALSFIAPENGTYWIGANAEITKLFGIWPGQAKENSIKIWIEKDGEQIWPETGKPMELNADTPSVALPGLTVAMKAGSAVRFCVQGTRENGDHNNVYLAPMAAKMGAYDATKDPVPVDNEHKHKEPGYTVPDGEMIDSLIPMIEAITDATTGNLNAFVDFSGWMPDLSWEFQYRINGVTDYDGDGFPEFITALGAKASDWSNPADGIPDAFTLTDGGRNEPKNAIQPANFLVPGKSVPIHCLALPHVEDSQQAVGALTFVAPQDGTYWIAGNQEVTTQFGIWKGQATDQPIKIWIEKDGVQIWPENGQPMILSEMLPSVTLPELNVAMKAGDRVRFCAMGTYDNGYNNNVYLYPVACRTGEYDASLDPAPGMGGNHSSSLNGDADSTEPIVDVVDDQPKPTFPWIPVSIAGGAVIVAAVVTAVLLIRRKKKVSQSE
ncbi:MAG: hypothetical protein IK954_02150 [Clostridia bacterium]|nr:hypothetical protein [Clostridia bacterium]